MPTPTPPPRYALEVPLPPYAHVPGLGLPHPVNDPGGHSYGHAPQPSPLLRDSLAQLPTDPTPRRRDLAALLVADSRWLHALDLFNEGFSWEAHEAWEQFWYALGRTTPDARFVQGLIHLAAAAVKIREGKPAGVATHTQRAREQLGGAGVAGEKGAADGPAIQVAAWTLGLDLDSLIAVFAELDAYRPECWHASRCPVVKFLTAGLRVAGHENTNGPMLIPLLPVPEPW